MEKFKCKLCFKQFVNGKALGGHMRSHLALLPLPPENQDSGGRSESTLSLCSSEEKKSRKRFRLVSPGRESEDTESTRNEFRRRSKRMRRISSAEKGKEKLAATESLESVLSSFSDDEEIATCLMMLSRDIWSGAELKNQENFFGLTKEPTVAATGQLLQCEICCRRFKSTQALGSHRTTHNNRGEFEGKPKMVGVKLEDQKMHGCPFCGKVFGSGQALGGHKRSHLSNSPTTKPAGSGTGTGTDTGSGSASSSSRLMIDLNLPAPTEYDDDDEPEVSAVSEAVKTYGG